MYYCCCFGHRELYLKIAEELDEIVENIIKQYHTVIFMTGGMGATDSQFISTVVKFRRKYPSVKLFLIMPYLTTELNESKEYYENLYDDIIIPDELMGVHYKSAIEKRNQWMVDRCDSIIDCTYRNFGGVYKAVKYAEKESKTIIKVTKK